MLLSVYKTGQLGQGIQEKTKQNLPSKDQVKADPIIANFLKIVFHKFYLVHSLVPWPNFSTEGCCCTKKFDPLLTLSKNNTKVIQLCLEREAMKNVEYF